jgi:hypothetical protein
MLDLSIDLVEVHAEHEARRNGSRSEPAYGKVVSLITSHSGRGSEKGGHE